MAETRNQDIPNIFAGYSLDEDRQMFIAALAEGVAYNCEEYDIADLADVNEDYNLAKSLGQEAKACPTLDESRVASFILGWDVDFQAVLYPQESENLTGIIFKARTSWGNRRYHVSTFQSKIFCYDFKIKAGPLYFRQLHSYQVSSQINPDLIYNPEDP